MRYLNIGIQWYRCGKCGLLFLDRHGKHCILCGSGDVKKVNGGDLF